MKILIQILNKNNKLQRVWINRSSLNRYAKATSKKLNSKNIWATPQNIEKFRIAAVKKLIKKKEKPKFSKRTGKTEFMHKRYARYRFPLYRRSINDQEKIAKLMIKIKSQYALVEKNNKTLKAQRIAVAITGEEREFHQIKRRDTGRERKTKIVTMIGTATYERESRATEAMFQELYEKLQQFIEGTLQSPSLLDEDEEKKAEDFHVFYTEE